MKEKEATVFLQEMEKKLDLKKYVYSGFFLWPIVKFKIFTSLTRNSISGISTASITRFQKIQSAFMGVGQLFKTGIDLKKSSLPSFISFTYSNSRRDIIDGKFKDVFFEDIYESLTGIMRPVVVEIPTSWNHPSPVYRPVDIFGELLILLRRFVKVPDEIRSIAKALEEDIGKYLRERGVLTEDRSCGIEKSIVNWWREHQAYRRIIQMADFRFLLFTVGYGNATASAGKSLGIPVIELQHGYIDQYHPGYMWGEYWMRDINSMPVADRILVYGDFWKEILTGPGAWPAERVISTGNPRIDFWKKKLEKERAGGRKANLAIVTSQNTVSRELASFIRQTAEILKDRKSGEKILVKLHPGEMGIADFLYEWAGEYRENVGIITDKDKKSLYEQLAESKVHASVYSTCHFESLAFDTPTVVIRLKNWERMGHMIENRWALDVSTPEEFADLLEKPPAFYDEKRKKLQAIRNYIWQDDAIGKIADFLKKYGDKS